MELVTLKSDTDRIRFVETTCNKSGAVVNFVTQRCQPESIEKWSGNSANFKVANK